MKKQIENTVYVIQNLAVPVLLFLFIRQDLAVLAYVTVLLSKWRVFAINPRFWLPNIRSNSCDIIVGISTVALMSSVPVSATQYVNPLLAVMYGVWLLFIKPRSSDISVAAQAFISQFYGLTALYLMLDFSISSLTWIVIILAWITGRVSARHFLSVYTEVTNKTILVSLWGFLVAQLAWIFWVWNVIYVLPRSVFAVPLISLVVGMLAYAVGSVFHAQQNKNLQKRFIIQQVLFVTTIIVLVVAFTGWTGQV